MPYESTATGRPPDRTSQPRSRRALLRLAAPVHPAWVHFTIALTVIAFGFDLLALLSGVSAWRSIGWWNLAAAVPITLMTLATGVKSRLDLPVEEGEARSFLRVHMALGPVVFGLLLMLAFWRARLWQAGSGVTWTYLIGMFLVLVTIGVQGYLGGELVYRYGAAVNSRYRELPGHQERNTRPARGRTNSARGRTNSDAGAGSEGSS